MENLTWECIKGVTGEYKGMAFVYQGCGVIEPREFNHRKYRRACFCETAARERYDTEYRRKEFIAMLAKNTYGWLGDTWADYPLLKKTFSNFDGSLQPDAYEGTKMFKDILSGTLILHGSYGTGKTHLLAALCNELHESEKASLFISATKIFRYVSEMISCHQSYDPAIQKMIHTPLLVIDDIDKAKHSDFREEVYFSIIDERVKRGLPIAISTNRLAELATFVGGACASRLSIGLIEIEMRGHDYRKGL